MYSLCCAAVQNVNEATPKPDVCFEPGAILGEPVESCLSDRLLEFEDFRSSRDEAQRNLWQLWFSQLSPPEAELVQKKLKLHDLNHQRGQLLGELLLNKKRVRGDKQPGALVELEDLARDIAELECDLGGPSFDRRRALLDSDECLSQNNVLRKRGFDGRFVEFEHIPHERAFRNKMAFEFWQESKAVKIEEKLDELKAGVRDKYLVTRVSASELKKRPSYYVEMLLSKRPQIYLDLYKAEAWASELAGLHEKLKLIRGSDYDLRDFVLESFGSYVREIKNHRLFVCGRDRGTGEYVAFRIYNRYQPEYVHLMYEFFEPLKCAKTVEMSYVTGPENKRVKHSAMVDLSKQVFLTLTYDPEKVKSQEWAWKHITDDWNRFKTRLFQVIGHKEYVAVVESQPQTGMPHIHVNFFGIDYLLWNGCWQEYGNIKKRNKKPTLENIWKRGFSSVNKTDDGKSVRQPLSYMFKYIDSTYGDKTVCEKGYQTQAFLWFFSRRCVFMSRGMSNWLKQRAHEKKEERGIEDIEGALHDPENIEWIGVCVVCDPSIEIESGSDLKRFIEQNNDHG